MILSIIQYWSDRLTNKSILKNSIYKKSTSPRNTYSMGTIYYFVFITIYCILSVVDSDRGSIQCRDENGDAVDWYVLYKLPKIRESSDPDIRKGTKYLYITDKTVSDGWRLSKEEISSKYSIPGRTLDPLYETRVSSNAMWILYNDQAPNRTGYSRFGHAKGVVMTDENNGFWLIHSVPRYPPKPGSDGEYSYPNTGMLYGQSLLCISLNANQMNDIGVQLIYNQITWYRYNFPKDLSMQFPCLANLTKTVQIDDPPYNHRAELQSMDGTQFISFAKTKKWQRDLYDDFVAPNLQTNLLTETWLNGPAKLPSNCNDTKVLNVESIVLDVANVEFKSTRDHSKWAIALRNKNNNNWVCIGDINRAKTQFYRGGGTVCINSLELWNSYRKSVNEIERCPKEGIFQQMEDWICSYSFLSIFLCDE